MGVVGERLVIEEKWDGGQFFVRKVENGAMLFLVDKWEGMGRKVAWPKHKAVWEKGLRHKGRTDPKSQRSPKTVETAGR